MSFSASLDEIVDQNRSGLLATADHWRRVPLGEVAEILNGYAFPSREFSDTEGMPLLRIRDVGRDRTDAFYTGDFDDKYRVKPGDLVIGMDGDFRCALWSGPEAVLNQRVCRVTPDEGRLRKRFLRYVLQPYLTAIHAHTSSVTVKHLSSKTVAKIPLPLPPLSEQDALADFLDVQSTRLFSASSELRRVEANLAKMRSSILESACTGGLVRQEGRPTPREGSPKPPAGWKRFKVEDLGDVQLGRQRAPEHHSGPNMRPYLRVANVLEDELDLADVKEMNFTPEAFEKYRLEPGDILLNEGQSKELVGRPAMFRGEIAEVAFQNTLIRFRAGPVLLSEFALLVFRNFLHNGRFTEVARWTTNIAHLGSRRFSKMEILVPPLEEQRRIVEEADRLFTIIKETERAAELASERGSSLWRSILRDTFSGRLPNTLVGEG